MNTSPDYFFDEQLAQLALHFELHRKNIYGSASPENASPFYAQLCQHIAVDPALLRSLVGVDQSTTITNLFFAAVHLRESWAMGGMGEIG